MTIRTRSIAHVVTAIMLIGNPLVLLADNHSVYELTPRLNIVAGDGEPSNDIPGIGLAIHRKISNEWYLGINIDHSPLFDFEDTAGLVDGLDEDGIVDADSSHTMITVVGERRYAMDSAGWTGFWNLGGGINEVDVDDVDGPLKGGGTYDIETDVDTELILVGAVPEDEAFAKVKSLSRSIDPRVRRNAVRALVLFEPRGAMRDLLDEALQDADPGVAETARRVDESLRAATAEKYFGIDLDS